jgi:hypothetical protein
LIKVVAYQPRHRERWDRFVREAKNGVFLFERAYMEYHSDRFSDASLVVLEDDELVGLLPANRVDGRLESHAGLTFGGLLTRPRTTTTAILNMFDALREHLVALGIREMVYKAAPHIYHQVPAEEDLYALFRHGARLVRRDLSVALPADHRPALTTLRRRCARRARQSGLVVGRSHDLARFLHIVRENLLLRHGVEPVHTAAEIELLAGRFRSNIKLYTATRQGQILGGVLIYESSRVAHVQYVGSTAEGRDLGAVDLVYEHLLSEEYAAKPWFDFGKSTDKEGLSLNTGLIAFKEGFGARGVAYDFYELRVAE